MSFVESSRELLEEFVDELPDEEDDEVAEFDEEGDPELDELLVGESGPVGADVSSGLSRELTGAILLGSTLSPQCNFVPKGQLQ